MPGLKNIVCLPVLLCLLLPFTACKKNEKQKTTGPPASTATLKSVAKFPVGAAIGLDLLQNNANYRDIVVREYSSITTENVLKFDATEPGEGQFDFSGGDYMVDFAQQLHIRVHAHNLIWHAALPGWVPAFSGDSLAWEALFKTHIQTVAAHYKGRVASWDVVNEAIRDDDGTLRNQDVYPGDGSIWRRHLGPDYIARAFQYAHEADPGALLFYNDYGQEWSNIKLNAIIRLVTGLKSRGIPVAGIGMQLHMDINTSNDGIKAALQQMAATGLLIHIAELDIAVNPGNDPAIVYNDAIQKAQAAKFQYVAETYRAVVPLAQQYGITTWNVTDADSWIPPTFKRKDWPLLFGSDYGRKPAYYSFLKGLGD